jgi:hypothetical protein
MSEPTGRAEMERRLLERSLQDDSFRQRLLEDPRATMEQELGVRLPADVQVIVVEETANTIYLVLPSASPLGEREELSERELDAVAGGAPGPTASGDTCSTAACGGFTCLDDLDCG